MFALSKIANEIFESCIDHYHVEDNVDQSFNNPYKDGSLEALFYQKCWIDTVQWHVEDLVRDPEIDSVQGLNYKRRIDQLNQKRTDLVEALDDYFINLFSTVNYLQTAKINTESPAWAFDRLSILALKIYHMRIETIRMDIEDQKRLFCKKKLALLLEQKSDLSNSIDELLNDISLGKIKMKVYRQVKMYNDPELNPVLYKNKQ